MLNQEKILNLLRNRNIVICLIGNFISTIGDCFNDIAIVSFIFIIYQSIDKLSLVYTSVYIAMFLASPLLGVLSDRLGKKRILCFSSLMQGGVVTIIILFPTLHVILSCIFFESILAVLVQITLRSTIKDNINPEYLLETNSLSVSITQVTRVISPAIAGIIMARWSENVISATRFVLGIDVFSFLFSSLLFLFIADSREITVERPGNSIITDMKSGWKALVKNRNIKVYYLYALSLSVAGTLPFLLKVPFVIDTLGGSTATLGLVNSFSAAGAIAGALLAGIILKDVNRKYFLPLRLLQGMSFFFLAFFNKFWVVFLFFFLGAMFQSTSKVSEESFMQHSIEKEVIGRVSSWHFSANAVIVLLMLRIGVLLSSIVGIEYLFIGVGIWNFLCFCLFCFIMDKNKGRARS